jgi:hypothetical protein
MVQEQVHPADPHDFHGVPMTSMEFRPVPELGYPGRTYKFYDGPEVLYSFGYGLSYTKFLYETGTNGSAIPGADQAGGGVPEGVRAGEGHRDRALHAERVQGVRHRGEDRVHRRAVRREQGAGRERRLVVVGVVPRKDRSLRLVSLRLSLSCFRVRVFLGFSILLNLNRK